MSDTPHVISVTRRIAAPASAIFTVLADPTRHVDIDGSDMIKGSHRTEPLSAEGDVFVMDMHNAEFGDYVMRNTVVEFEPDALIGWAPARADAEGGGWQHRWRFRLEPDGPDATFVTEQFDLTRSPADAHRILRDGERWRPDMERTLARLDEIVAPGG